MAHRERVVAELGSKWVAGQLSSDEYFDQVREEALKSARSKVAQRIRLQKVKKKTA